MREIFILFHQQTIRKSSLWKPIYITIWYDPFTTPLSSGQTASLHHGQQESSPRGDNKLFSQIKPVLEVFAKGASTQSEQEVDKCPWGNVTEGAIIII